jgi:2-polyprenyl-6-methoxyphenol hydroxylase-like FAD-dependent oxidoreductase
MQVQGFGTIPLDISDVPTRRNHGLALWQRDIERILADWVLGDLGVPILRSCEVVGLTQDDAGVDLELAGGGSRRAAYVVGCDGGRSVVRKAAGIAFTGSNPTTSWMIAEIEVDGDPELGFRRDRLGQHAMGRRAPDEPIHVVLTEAEVDHAGPPTLEELREALVAVYGTDHGLRRASSISRFTDATRQAVAYRAGRVLLAGDAAHIHPPQGGQGLNVGVQDAVNLGWKLAMVVHGTAPDALLDTYHAERHPVGARAIQLTRAAVALTSPDDHHQALRDVVTDVLALDGPRHLLATRLAGLDVRYDLGEGHPLLGRRMPDLELATADGPVHASSLLHDARPVLLDLGAGVGDREVGPWANRVRSVVARHDGPWELPVVGPVPGPGAVLIRPDGHVAWVGGEDGADDGLEAALATWFGP